MIKHLILPKPTLIQILLAWVAFFLLTTAVVFAGEPGSPGIRLELKQSPELLYTNAMRASAEDTGTSGDSPDNMPVLSSDPAIEAYLGKRPQQAFLRSLVFPGWGQRWSGRPLRGANYTGVDAGLWGALILFWQSHVSLTGAYEAYAHQHADITGSRSHQYYVDIGNYDTVYAFNDYRRQTRQYDSQYDPGADWWRWDDPEHREVYKDLRIRADRDGNRRYYVIGAMVLNRLVSAIDAGRGMAKRQKQLKERNGLSLGFDQITGTPTAGISIILDR